MVRIFFAFLALLAACGEPTWIPGDGDQPPIPEVVPEEPVSADPLEGRGDVYLVDDGFQFLEGPKWVPALGALLFSDVQASTIYRLDPPHRVSVFRQPSGYANGLAVDHEGNLLICEHQTRRVSRLSETGDYESIAEKYQNSRLNSPNDLVVRGDGVVFFTDPPYATPVGYEELAFAGVFRISSVGVISAEYRGPYSSRPNGIVLSPDEQTLYVADTAARKILSFEVSQNGVLSAPTVFSEEDCAGDGMAVDERGNLYVGCTDGELGVLVLAKDGTAWGRIPMEVGVTNVGFGDDKRTLYMTTAHALYRVSLNTIGIY